MGPGLRHRFRSGVPAWAARRGQGGRGVGGRILEVGVGTGLSLADYGKGTRIVGIDISEPMLEKARKRVEAQGLARVEALEVMDAEHLTVPGRLLRCRGGAVCGHRHSEPGKGAG